MYLNFVRAGSYILVHLIIDMDSIRTINTHR